MADYHDNPNFWNSSSYHKESPGRRSCGPKTKVINTRAKALDGVNGRSKKEWVSLIKNCGYNGKLMGDIHDIFRMFDLDSRNRKFISKGNPQQEQRIKNSLELYNAVNGGIPIFGTVVCLMGPNPVPTLMNICGGVIREGGKIFPIVSAETKMYRTFRTDTFLRHVATRYGLTQVHIADQIEVSIVNPDETREVIRGKNPDATDISGGTPAMIAGAFLAQQPSIIWCDYESRDKGLAVTGTEFLNIA